MAFGFKPVSGVEKTNQIKLAVKNGTTITAGDPVFLDNASGINRLNLATSSNPIYGVALETGTGNSGGTVEISVLKANYDTVFEIDNDNDTDTFGTTGDRGAGNYFNIVSSTGAVQVDTSSGGTVSTSKQLICVYETPDSSDVSLGWFKINPAMLQA